MYLLHTISKFFATVVPAMVPNITVNENITINGDNVAGKNHLIILIP